MKKKLATVPRLVMPKKGTWYIYFQVRDPFTDKMKPMRIYRGFKERKLIHERKRWGERLVKEYTDKLRAGWTPFDENSNDIYSDNLQYENYSVRFNNLRSSSRNMRYYLNSFLEQRKAGLKPNTYKTYVSKTRIFCNWIENNGYGDYDVSAISNDIIKEFFKFIIFERGLDKLTVEKYVQIVKSYFDFLKDRCRVNPVHGIVLPVKKLDKAARPINSNDLYVLLEAIKESDPQLYLSCMFIYYLALRPGQELRLLKIKDVDIYNGIVTVTDDNAKTTRRTVDMPNHLMELCENYYLQRYNRDYFVFGRYGKPGPEPTGKNTLRVRFNRIRDRLNLPDIYKYYSLKHTGGGNLLAAGATIEEIKSHFGHTSIETTDRYLKRHFGNRNQRIIKDFPRPY